MVDEGEEYTKEELSKLSNPKNIGPGSWDCLHKLARYADETNNQKFYADFVRFFCQNFNCGTCRIHCIDHQEKNPPEKYIGQKWGMSWHSFNFHNKANKALGKKQMPWSQYAKIYLNLNEKESILYCKEGCGDAQKVPSPPAGGGLIQAFAGGSGEQKKNSEAIDARGFKELWAVSKRDPELARHKKNKNGSNGDKSKGDTLHLRKK